MLNRLVKMALLPWLRPLKWCLSIYNTHGASKEFLGLN